MLDSDTATLIQTPCYLLSDSLKNTLTPLSDSLIQSDEGSHHQFYHAWIQPFCTKLWLKLNSFSLILMMSATVNTAILDSAILEFTHSFWPSWWCQLTLPCWIQPLPSWIQTPCYLLSDSLKNTLTPNLILWIWLKLIHSYQLDDVSHLEFCHLGFNHFEQKKLLIHSQTWWWQPSWILPSMNKKI